MIEVYLDNQALEVPDTTSVGINVGIASIEDPISASASYSQTIDVPMTPHNTAIFEHTEQILSPQIFNHSEHTAAVYEDGVELIKGKAYFEGATDTHYKLQIVGNEFDWLQSIRDKKLNEIDDTVVSAFREWEALTDVEREAVFFALTEHGKWWQNIDDETVRRRWATYADLVPFVSVQNILQSIFKGYSIDSHSIGYLLSQLYITGEWKAPDNADVLAEDNAFKLSCSGNNLTDVVVKGESNTVVGGKITATDNPLMVDVFDTKDDDPNSRIVMESETHSVGGEEIEHYIPHFEPSEALTTAYKLRLKYTTSMAYLSPQLGYAFADTIHFGGSKVAKLTVDDGLQALDDKGVRNAGSFNSARITATPTSLTPSEVTGFSVEISDPDKYTEVVQICWKINTSGTISSNIQTITAINGSSRVYFSGACNFDYSMRGEHIRAAIGLKTKYGDIVVIGGNCMAHQTISFANNVVKLKNTPTVQNLQRVRVELFRAPQSGSITFEVNLLTTGYDVPSGGTGLQVGFSSSLALGSNELLVSVEEAEIEPVFNFVKKYNDPISLNDVGGDAQATDMLKAIMHLFNLRIYANSDTKIVHIIPYSEFYTDTVVDWSDRIDRDKGIDISTVGDNIGKSFRLCYAEDNAVIADYNKRHKEPYLSWSVPLLSKRTTEDYELANDVLNAPISVEAYTIFPTTTYTGQLLQLAGDDNQGTLDELEVSELPRTVVLRQPATGASGNIFNVGCVGLLEGYEQPNFTIVDSSYQWCISFADTEGVPGLHKYYDKQVEAWNYGKRITCYCRVLPQEIESLRKAGSSPVDFRSRFKLTINGEDIYCRLESIENYEPQNVTHKCSFLYME